MVLKKVSLFFLLTNFWAYTNSEKLISVASSVKGGKLNFEFQQPIKLKNNCEIALKSYFFEKNWYNLDRPTKINIWKYDLDKVKEKINENSIDLNPDILIQTDTVVKSTEGRSEISFFRLIDQALLKTKIPDGDVQSKPTIFPTIEYDYKSYAIGLQLGSFQKSILVLVFENPIFRMFNITLEQYIDQIEKKIRKSAKNENFRLDVPNLRLILPKVHFNIREGTRILSLNSDLVKKFNYLYPNFNRRFRRKNSKLRSRFRI